MYDYTNGTRIRRIENKLWYKSPVFRKLSYSTLLSSRSRKKFGSSQEFTSQCYIPPNTHYSLFPMKNWLTFGLRRISQSYPFLSLVPIDMETLLLLTHNSSAWKSVFISVCWSTPREIFKDDEKPPLSILLLYSVCIISRPNKNPEI